MRSAIVQTEYGQAQDLVEQAADWPYLFIEHTLLPGKASRFRTDVADHRSFVVVRGIAELRFLRQDGSLGTQRYDYLKGWHALPGSVFRIGNVSGQAAAVVVEAGSVRGSTRETADLTELRGKATAFDYPEVSYYIVNKPWGHEVWYTQNLPDPPYALKQIHMTAGHQSSLQSHQHKAETNYVIDGEATVLNGVVAPDDHNAVIDPAELPTSIHCAGTGWTSAPQVLHRVIARSDYTSIEVSTPELDDVIRWQDDTRRKHGRIDAEHAAGRP
jgi:hypothetical protein